MSDQERGRAYPSTDQDCDENRAMESRAMMDYDYIPLLSDQETISTEFCREEAHEASHYYDMLDNLSMFEIPSPLLQGVGPSETPCLEDVIETEKGHASDFLETQTKRDLQEGGVKEDSDTNGQSKQQKRIRCPEVHNHNERVRRQKLKEKMKALRELIPDCNSRDKLSTLDEAIKYIKTLQYQLQMMSMGAGYSTSHSPFMMMAQPIQNGLQIPYNIPQTSPPQARMGIPSMLPPLDFPRNHPYFLPSSATSRPPASGGIHPRNIVQQTTQGATNPSSQHPTY